MLVVELVEELIDAGVKIAVNDGELHLSLPKTLNEGLKQRLLQNKVEVKRYLLDVDKRKHANSSPAIEKLNLSQGRLSYAQQRLWLIDKMGHGSAEYNRMVAYSVNGRFDLELFESILTQVIQRHQVLRTCFIEENGETFQKVSGEFNFSVRRVDLSHLSEPEKEIQVRTFLQNEAQTPFLLSHDLMVRASSLMLEKQNGESLEKSILLLTVHHIASDGWSIDILTREVFALYHAFISGTSPHLEELPVQYLDYAEWQRNTLTEEKLQRQLDYWVEQLADLPAVHSLPLDFKRPKKPDVRGNVLSRSINAEQVEKIVELARELQLTPFMLMHGVLSLLLSRYSACSDIVIGTPVANRLHREVEGLIGFFVNTLVLRVNTDKTLLKTYFEHVRNTNLQAQSNQEVPFEQLVKHLQVPRTQLHTPVFQIMLNASTDYGVSSESEKQGFVLKDVSVQPLRNDIVQTKFDLELNYTLSDSGAEFHWVYNCSLFSENTIDSLSRHFIFLLSEVLKIEDWETASLQQLEMLSQKDKQQLFDVLRGKVTDVPDYDVCEKIHQQVKSTPDALAVTWGDESLTYRELDKQSGYLATALKNEHSIARNSIVALVMPRSLEMVIGIFAVMKTGAAYTLIDPESGQQRIAEIMENAGVSVVLTQTSMEPDISAKSVSVSEFLNSSLLEYDAEILLEGIQERELDDLCYVIYTSGSTGKPKGVEVTRGNLNDYCAFAEQEYYSERMSGSLLVTSPYFDISIPALFLPLIHGHVLDLGKEENGLLDFVSRIESSEQERYLLRMTPTHIEALLSLMTRSSCNAKHTFVIGGESFPIELANKLQSCFPNSRVINHYGPSEATVGCSMFDATEHTLGLCASVPIGRPMNNTELLILDDKRNMVPRGAIGELYIGGNGVAKGYLNQEQLTCERFVNIVPGFDRSGDTWRMYRSGDLVRLNPDGNIEFIGRSDDQLKIRGFRIEPSEIESRLRAISGIDSALVVVSNVGKRGDVLVAYIKPELEYVTEHDEDAFIQEIKKQLNGRLPHYMQPEAIILLEGWPTGANGKVDRKVLPLPDFESLQGEYVAPESSTEVAITEMCSVLLGIEQKSISISANFFSLGGHSLLVVKLLALMNERLDVVLSMNDIFQSVSLKDLAWLCESKLKAKCLSEDLQRLSADELDEIEF